MAAPASFSSGRGNGIASTRARARPLSPCHRQSPLGVCWKTGHRTMRCNRRVLLRSAQKGNRAQSSSSAINMFNRFALAPTYLGGRYLSENPQGRNVLRSDPAFRCRWIRYPVPQKPTDRERIHEGVCRAGVSVSGWGHGRFGTTHACFSTASISRPSASATVGLLSATSGLSRCKRRLRRPLRLSA